MCISDDKLALINAIIQSDELFEEIAEFLNEATTEEESGEATEQEEEGNPFKSGASKPVYAWE